MLFGFVTVLPVDIPGGGDASEAPGVREDGVCHGSVGRKPPWDRVVPCSKLHFSGGWERDVVEVCSRNAVLDRSHAASIVADMPS